MIDRSHVYTFDGLQPFFSVHLFSMSEGEPFGEGLIIRKATNDDFEDILEFVCNEFIVNEPITNALHGKRSDMEDMLKGVVLRNKLFRNQSSNFSVIFSSKGLLWK